MGLFIETLWSEPRFFFMTAIIVIFSICCHEYMHAFIALKLGDSTAADRGHLTLNPFRQMGVFSLIMFAVIGIAWGQVPVNPNRMRGKYAPALTAAAGPLTNLVLGVLFSLASAVILRVSGNENVFAVEMMLYGGAINIVLFLLNIIPIPGFDGWAVLTTLFPRIRSTSSEFVHGSFFVILMLLFIGFNYLYAVAFLLASLLRNFAAIGLFRLFPLS